MNKANFYKLRKAAANEVAAYLADGYMIICTADLWCSLRHCRNGSKIIVKVDMAQGTMTVKKNGSIVKTLNYG